MTVSVLVKEIRCVVTNETTLEMTVNSRIRSSNPAFQNPYDLGLMANLKQVFSSSPLMWILPLPLPFNHDDGLYYRTRHTTSNDSI